MVVGGNGTIKSPARDFIQKLIPGIDPDTGQCAAGQHFLFYWCSLPPFGFHRLIPCKRLEERVYKVTTFFPEVQCLILRSALANLLEQLTPCYVTQH